ncbi:MAG TPA: thioredoxin family protein [Burkholderiales bacterium]|nr:thioredoxin family protein [Burkholderiales bacterium]
MEIKILGPGCARCRRLEELAREAVTEAGVSATITKVTDIAAITSYPILGTPGLVINGAVKSSGHIPRKEDILGWIKESD